MAHPLLSLVAAAARWQQRRFVQRLPRATAIQERFLKRLLGFHQDTVLGQDLGLSQITTLAAFRRQVPVWSYAQHAPYFERTAAGESNVVTPEPILHINLSSGSTGQQKRVPIPHRARQKRVHANNIAMGFAFAAAQRRGVTAGKLLFTASAQPLGHTEGGIPYGHVSGNQLRDSNSVFYRHIFAQPFDALFIRETLTRTYVCLLFALGESDLAVIAAIFPRVALQLCQYLETYGESLIEDLERGTIAPWLALDEGLRSRLNRALRPHPRRSRQLRALLRSQGQLLPYQVWPHLAFLVTARGGPSDFYFERLRAYFGDTPIFGGTYSASEAVFGCCYDLDTDGALLAIDTNFFEFVPPDQWDAETPRTLLPHEVQVGEYYRMLVTNYSGFYRYDIGDVVEVTGFWGPVPLIAFRYRRGGTLSAISEKTTEQHLTQVMTRLRSTHSLPLEDFCLTVSAELLKPYYVLNLELSSPVTGAALTALLHDFDRQLQIANPSYGLKRQNGDMASPQLNLLASGSFAHLRQQQLKPGLADDAQVKLPHLSRDRALLATVEIVQQIQLSAETTP